MGRQKKVLWSWQKKTTQEVPKVAPTPSSLSTQAAQIHQRLQQVKSGVERIQDLKVTLPDETVKKAATRLEHIDEGLRDVAKLSKGVELGSVKGIAEGKPPLARFLTYLTESDKKLNTFFDELGGMKIGEQKLSPDVLMAVQIKLGFITQELEFFTSTLNKALESTKTVMNVQI
jgi:Tfp pilus assembly protein PilN